MQCDAKYEIYFKHQHIITFFCTKESNHEGSHGQYLEWKGDPYIHIKKDLIKGGLK